MELKKSPNADLEKNRGIFLQIGFVVTLGILLVAFEWTSSKGEVGGLGSLGASNVEEEIIPITRQEEVKPPPPPPPPKVTEVLNIVEDDVEIEDELEIEESEADENMEIEMIEMEEEEVEEEQIFTIVEDMPQFPGGDGALMNYIASHVVYPEIAKENGITGRVYVRFVVDRKGNVDKVTIARGVDPSLDKAAMDVIKSMPNWSPGKQRGKPVNVWYTAPINFVLN